MAASAAKQKSQKLSSQTELGLNPDQHKSAHERAKLSYGGQRPNLTQVISRKLRSSGAPNAGVRWRTPLGVGTTRSDSVSGDVSGVTARQESEGESLVRGRHRRSPTALLRRAQRRNNKLFQRGIVQDDAETFNKLAEIHNHGRTRRELLVDGDEAGQSHRQATELGVDPTSLRGSGQVIGEEDRRVDAEGASREASGEGQKEGAVGRAPPTPPAPRSEHSGSVLDRGPRRSSPSSRAGAARDRGKPRRRTKHSLVRTIARQIQDLVQILYCIEIDDDDPIQEPERGAAEKSPALDEWSGGLAPQCQPKESVGFTDRQVGGASGSGDVSGITGALTKREREAVTLGGASGSGDVSGITGALTKREREAVTLDELEGDCREACSEAGPTGGRPVDNPAVAEPPAEPSEACHSGVAGSQPMIMGFISDVEVAAAGSGELSQSAACIADLKPGDQVEFLSDAPALRRYLEEFGRYVGDDYRELTLPKGAHGRVLRNSAWNGRRFLDLAVDGFETVVRGNPRDAYPDTPPVRLGFPEDVPGFALALRAQIYTGSMSTLRNGPSLPPDGAREAGGVFH